MSLPQEPAFPADPPAPPKRNNTVLWVIVILVVGGLCFGLVILAAILFPVFSQARVAAQKTACLSNIKKVGVAHLIYSADNDDRLPLGPNWDQVVASYLSEKDAMHCPVAKKENGPAAVGFGLNRDVTGVPNPAIADVQRTIVVFESQDLSLGFVGGQDDLADPPRHPQGGTFAMADSSARFIKFDDLTTPSGGTYSWKP